LALLVLFLAEVEESEKVGGAQNYLSYGIWRVVDGCDYNSMQIILSMYGPFRMVWRMCPLENFEKHITNLIW